MPDLSLTGEGSGRELGGEDTLELKPYFFMRLKECVGIFPIEGGKMQKPHSTNKCQRRCSTSFVSRELQSKTTIRHYFTPIRLAKINISDITEYWQEDGTKGTTCRAGGSVNWHNYCGKLLGNL